MATHSIAKSYFSPEFLRALHDDILSSVLGAGSYGVSADGNAVTVKTPSDNLAALQNLLTKYLSLTPDVVTAEIEVGNAVSQVIINCPAGGRPALMAQVHFTNQLWTAPVSVPAIADVVTVEIYGDDLEAEGYYVIEFYDPADRATTGMCLVVTEGYLNATNE